MLQPARERMRRALLVSLALIAPVTSILLFEPSPARADEFGGRPRVEAPMRPWAITLEATPGFALFVNNGRFPAYAIGAGAMFRYRMLEVGAFRDSTIEPRFYGLKSQATGAMIGARVFANSLRGFDALLIGGFHEFQGVGSENLAGSPGSRGTSPFLGLRAGGNATLGSGVVRLSAGLWLFTLFDLSRQTVAVTRPKDFGPQAESQATVGDVEFGLTVRFGIELGPLTRAVVEAEPPQPANPSN